MFIGFEELIDRRAVSRECFGFCVDLSKMSGTFLTDLLALVRAFSGNQTQYLTETTQVLRAWNQQNAPAHSRAVTSVTKDSFHILHSSSKTSSII